MVAQRGDGGVGAGEQQRCGAARRAGSARTDAAIDALRGTSGATHIQALPPRSSGRRRHRSCRWTWQRWTSAAAPLPRAAVRLMRSWSFSQFHSLTHPAPAHTIVTTGQIQKKIQNSTRCFFSKSTAILKDQHGLFSNQRPYSWAARERQPTTRRKERLRPNMMQQRYQPQSTVCPPTVSHPLL